MTVDDLIAVFEKARAEAAPFPQHHEDGLYAGIAAVVRALRDAIVEDGNCKYCVATTAMYNEILGDAGEKVAGNQWTASTQPPMRNNADAAPVCDVCNGRGEILVRTMHDPDGPGDIDTCPECYVVTDAAPAVCVWEPDFEPFCWTDCSGEQRLEKGTVDCPSCGKPIKFTEANHG